MDLVEGTNLRNWLREKQRPWREVLDVVLAAGRGLAAAHAAGVVHRDFKPENVLVGRDGRVQVTDFGLARLVDSELVTTPDLSSPGTEIGSRLGAVVTQDGVIIGTPTWQSVPH
jgi:serine/threonine-protein kinase